MKTIKIIYILVFLLGLQLDSIFAAGNFNSSNGSAKDEAPVCEINISNLAPVTPGVADFEDDPGSCNPVTVMELSPVVPADADFDDQV